MMLRKTIMIYHHPWVFWGVVTLGCGGWLVSGCGGGSDANTNTNDTANLNDNSLDNNNDNDSEDNTETLLQEFANAIAEDLQAAHDCGDLTSPLLTAEEVLVALNEDYQQTDGTLTLIEFAQQQAQFFSDRADLACALPSNSNANQNQNRNDNS